jgi:MFS family permease
MISLKTSLKLIQVEIIITGALISMPIMVPFYNSIGMDQGQIGLSQTIFTLALLMLNIPTGWIADRFSRKICNAAGDLGAVIALLMYSQSTCFFDVVVAEILLGVALAFSQGADSALTKAHTDLLDKKGKYGLFHRVNTTNAIWRPIAQIIALTIGGIIGPVNYSLAIAVSAVPYFIGFVLSLIIREEGERRIQKHKNPLRDIWQIVYETVIPNAKLRWLIVAFAAGSSITHVMIWALTPLMIAAGLPMQVIGAGWVLNAIATTVGAMLAKRYALRLIKWKRLAVPAIIILSAMVIMSINLSAYTVWLYATLGAGYGWYAGVLIAMIQNETPGGNQSTAVSIAGTFSQLIYAPLVWFISWAGNIDIRYSLIATIIIFAPIMFITTRKLRRLET